MAHRAWSKIPINTAADALLSSALTKPFRIRSEPRQRQPITDFCGLLI